MNILYVWDGEYPWDVRVEKICNTLQVKHNDVCIVCRNQKRSPLVDSYGGIAIYRLPFLSKWLGSLNSIFTFPAFFNPVWLLRIFIVARKMRCDCIIVRDLPMALAGISIARILKVPCVLDMAECYPEMLRCTWKFEGISFKNFFIRNPWCADLVEWIVMKRISHVWVMIEESRDRLLRKGVDHAKISIVSNTPVIGKFTDNKITKMLGDEYSIIYVGLLNPSRGLDTVLDAVYLYTKINRNFHLTIVGSGKARKSLESRMKELSLDNFVTFLGWVENESIPKLIATADVGIVPHHNCGHWANTIPNKLFDYMASGKPVIVSNVAPMKRLVENIKCGRVYEDYNPNQLCDIISELSDYRLRQNLAKNGMDAIANNYNWEEEESVIFDSINKLKK